MPKEPWPFATPGIPDELFLRDEVPMTREEVRALWLAKARLKPGQVVYDIGAGTGSLTVEAARLVAPGTVWAVERAPKAASLVRANAERFGLNNVKVVEGEAPEALEGLPVPDRVMVGGSSRRLAAILACCAAKLRQGGIMVIGAVTWETLAAGLDFFDRAAHWQVEAVCLNVAKLSPLGGSRVWKAHNPVYLLRASKKEEPFAG